MIEYDVQRSIAGSKTFEKVEYEIVNYKIEKNTPNVIA